MVILINCSNLKKGGALQVADSVCSCLINYPQYYFVVVLSNALDNLARRIKEYSNVYVVRYDIRNDFKTLLLGRDSVLDNLVQKYGVNVVLTLFGPSRWTPRCKHICGFARPHLVLDDSPYYQRMTFFSRMKEKLHNKILKYYFGRGVDVMWTENPYISEKVNHLFPDIRVVTVTNYYNQIFDQSDKWVWYKLPSFEGVTLLSVNAFYSHKNTDIALDVAEILHQKHPEFKFRFVLTISEKEFPSIPDELKQNFLFIGKVNIEEVPSLYQQADICFQPTLLECFSATYPEAMRMNVPILTTDLDFAKGLCGNAAKYYSAVNAEDCMDAIYKMANDVVLRDRLCQLGKLQLKHFDNYEERARKLIKIACELVES